MASFNKRVSNEIKSIAKSTSQGECAKYVREAIQKANNIPVKPIGISSAKDYGPWLENNGYSRTNKSPSQANVGDVAVFSASTGHPHGHIQILCDDNRWRSDFTQNNFIPYRVTPSDLTYTIYEHY